MKADEEKRGKDGLRDGKEEAMRNEFREETGETNTAKDIVKGDEIQKTEEKR